MSEPPSSPPETPPGPAAQQPPAASERKGLSPLAWVLIVLGTLVLLSAGACVACGVLFMNTARDFAENPARAAAELAVRADPDLEVVDSNPDAGTLTVRNKETGEEATFDFEEIAQGRFSWSTDEGEGGVDVSGDGEEGRITVRSKEGSTVIGAGATDDLPGWLPPYPDAEVDPGGYATREAERVSGSFSLLTEDEASTAIERWQEILEEEGFEVVVQTISGGDQEVRGLVIGETEEPRRQVSVTVARQEGRTRMLVQYEGPGAG